MAASVQGVIAVLRQEGYRTSHDRKRQGIRVSRCQGGVSIVVDYDSVDASGWRCDEIRDALLARGDVNFVRTSATRLVVQDPPSEGLPQ